MFRFPSFQPRFGSLPSIDEIIAKETSWRNAVEPSDDDDEPLPLDEPVFDIHPLSRHYKGRINEILAGIREKNLPLKLFAGEAKIRSTKPHPPAEVWKLADGKGMEFQFIIQEDEGKPFENYGVLHAMWLKVDVAIQGAFWRLKRFWEQVADLLLEKCGYSFIYGRAVWSSNSQIKGLAEPNRDMDWRWIQKFVGWDEKLRPIVVQGLVLMYLRLGFFLHPDKADENLVIYPSRQRIKQFIALNGQAEWDKLTELSLSRRKEWHTKQKERAAQISQPETIIRAAIERATHNQKEKEGDFAHLWTNRPQQIPNSLGWRF
jgi:hypothetical protein